MYKPRQDSVSLSRIFKREERVTFLLRDDPFKGNKYKTSFNSIIASFNFRLPVR